MLEAAVELGVSWAKLLNLPGLKLVAIVAGCAATRCCVEDVALADWALARLAAFAEDAAEREESCSGVYSTREVMARGAGAC